MLEDEEAELNSADLAGSLLVPVVYVVGDVLAQAPGDLVAHHVKVPATGGTDLLLLGVAIVGQELLPAEVLPAHRSTAVLAVVPDIHDGTEFSTADRAIFAAAHLWPLGL